MKPELFQNIPIGTKFNVHGETGFKYMKVTPLEAVYIPSTTVFKTSVMHISNTKIVFVSTAKPSYPPEVRKLLRQAQKAIVQSEDTVVAFCLDNFEAPEDVTEEMRNEWEDVTEENQKVINAINTLLS